MNIKNSFVLAAAIAAASIGGASIANADPIFTGNYSVWSADTFGSNATSTAAIQQALPSAITAFNSLPTSGSSNGHLQTGSGTYTGQLNFTDNSDNSISGFFGDDAGSFTHTGCTGSCGSDQLSTGSFGHVTLMEFTITLSATELLDISHDDGVSIFAHGNTSTDLLPTSDASPTTDVDSLVTLGPGTYDLYYTEANGLPADLNVNATPVPEPVSIVLLGTALIGLGAVRRRRRTEA